VVASVLTGKEGGGVGGKVVFCFLLSFSPLTHSLAGSFSPSLLLIGMGPSCYYSLQEPLHPFLPPYLVPVHRPVAPGDRDCGPQASTKNAEYDEFRRCTQDRRGIQGHVPSYCPICGGGRGRGGGGGGLSGREEHCALSGQSACAEVAGEE